MSPQVIFDIITHTIWTGLIVVAPILIVGFLLGMLLSFFQALFQMQDPTVAVVPKIVGISLSIVLLGKWMMGYLLQYALKYLGNFESLIQ